MFTIDKGAVQSQLDSFSNQDVYVHLETSNGSYASLRDDSMASVCAFIRNGKIKYSRGVIKGEHPYRVGLKLEEGWIYATGLTDFEMTSTGQLLLAGHDNDGRLTVALELSVAPFRM